MSKPSFNKSSLKKERDNLSTYQQFLPSLDLKRQQFMVELKKAKEAIALTDRTIADIEEQSSDWIPFLADKEIELSAPIDIEKVVIEKENFLGIQLPVLTDIKIKKKEYSFVDTPIWFDSFVSAFQEIIALRLRKQIEIERLAIIEEALQTITQRVNLFDKVLIPSAKKNIRQIKLVLAELENAGVIRSKLAKKKK